MTKRQFRRWENVLLLLTIVVLGCAYYFQFAKGLAPCPLCIMQRICTFGIGFFCLMGIYLGSLRRARLVVVSQTVCSLLGIFFSGRQLWLQALPPDKLPACVPGLDVLYRYFPIKDVMQALVWGSGDCAEVSWRWLGITMPGWAMVYFVFILLGSVLLWVRLIRSMQQQVQAGTPL